MSDEDDKPLRAIITVVYVHNVKSKEDGELLRDAVEKGVRANFRRQMRDKNISDEQIEASGTDIVGVGLVLTEIEGDKDG